MSEFGRVSLSREEFVRLTLEHCDALYHAAMTLTRQHADALDLVQDTYLKAHRFWRRFEPGTNMKAWLLTILRNAFINTYRKTTRRHIQDEVEPSVPSWADMPLFPVCTEQPMLEEVLRHAVQDEVKQALDELPEEFRLVVLLADLEERSYKDIAAILGCPVGTVMSRLCRGRKQLRKRLKTFAQECGYLRTADSESAVLFA